MKTLILPLFMVLGVWAAEFSGSFSHKDNENKLELIFKIKQDEIKKMDGYFNAELIIRNISNDTLKIPGWIRYDIGCGQYPGTVNLEIYYLDGTQYIPPISTTDIDFTPGFSDSIYLKPNDTIKLNFSKKDTRISCGCPITKKGTYKIRAELELYKENGIPDYYESNFDTLRVK